MNGEVRPSIEQRKAEVQRRLSLSAIVERHVKLSGTAASSRRRGKCPFHGSNSPSLALFDADKGTGAAHCFGCQWSGDIFAFQQAIRGIGFMDALAELESLCGAGPQVAEGDRATGSGTVQRERNPSPPRRRELIEPIDMGRWIWRRARPDEAAVRRYFRGRGVPEAVLDGRLGEFRYLPECPAAPWREGSPPLKGLPIAPAIVALVKVPMLFTPSDAGRAPSGALGSPRMGSDGRSALRPGEAWPEGAWLEFVPTGLHVTYLNPAGDGTMKRRKPWAADDDPDPWLPKRRMVGPVGGGCVLLGDYSPEAHLYVGEGNETVLSGMGLAGAQVAGGGSAVGIATLSLGNLQGEPKLWSNRTWPLFDIEPDPERPPFTIPGHRGRVTGLVDSDMRPLRGRRRPTAALLEAGASEYEGEAVVERRGGPIVRRAITGAERARICGELIVKGWRAAGVHQVDAVRAPLGKDFNDAARELAA